MCRMDFIVFKVPNKNLSVKVTLDCEMNILKKTNKTTKWASSKNRHELYLDQFSLRYLSLMHVLVCVRVRLLAPVEKCQSVDVGQNNCGLLYRTGAGNATLSLVFGWYRSQVSTIYPEEPVGPVILALWFASAALSVLLGGLLCWQCLRNTSI